MRARISELIPIIKESCVDSNAAVGTAHAFWGRVLYIYIYVRVQREECFKSFDAPLERPQAMQFTGQRAVFMRALVSG